MELSRPKVKILTFQEKLPQPEKKNQNNLL